MRQATAQRTKGSNGCRECSPPQVQIVIGPRDKDHYHIRSPLSRALYIHRLGYTCRSHVRAHERDETHSQNIDLGLRRLIHNQNLSPVSNRMLQSEI